MNLKEIVDALKTISVLPRNIANQAIIDACHLLEIQEEKIEHLETLVKEFGETIKELQERSKLE